jgi:hypothetical protein
MRPAVLLALATVGCDPAPDATDVRLRLLTADATEPLVDGSDLEVGVRPQGGFGAHVGLQIIGLAADEIERFSIALDSDAGEPLADQPFLPLSTGQEREDGSIAIAELPVVFFEAVDTTAVEDRAATLRARMDVEPVATSEVEVVLRRRDG